LETLESKVAKCGKSIITGLHILIKTTGIYDSMNETILNMAQKLMVDIELLMEESGEFTIKMIEGSFYIEGIRIKAGVSDIDIFNSLSDELKRRSIGSLDFKAPIKADDLIHLAYAIKEGNEASEIQSAVEKKVAEGISIGGPVFLHKEEGIDLKDNYAMAKRAYLKSVVVVKEMFNSLRGGTRVKLKKIKRTLQLIVDCASADQCKSSLIRFIHAGGPEDYTYYHSVNVCVLSVALGEKIGLSRVHLRTLAMAGIFHDIGKIMVPSVILNKKSGFTSKEQELLKRHPVDGIKVLLKSFGLSETLILSMLVSFEHHMELDLSGYPVVSGKRKLNLFSRIISIANRYDSLISGRVYGREKLGAGDALGLMLKDSGTLYDPLLIKAFADIFRK
jgi:HD-GYP domain-containing protein (c-di-GMP phosphodiesterase class II)